MLQGMNHPGSAQGWALQSLSTFTEQGAGIALNPATVSLSPRMVKFNYTNFVQDINSTNLTYISAKKNYELSLRYLNYGEFKHRNTEGQELGNYSVKDIYSRISWGTKIANNFYGGLNIHYGYSKFHQETAGYLTSGIGLLYFFPAEIRLGFSTINQVITGQGYNRDEPPVSYAILSGSKKLTHMPMRIGLDIIRNSLDHYYANIGGNLMLNTFNIYWGLSSKRRDLQTSDELTNLIAGISTGFGLDINNYNLGFGFRNLGAMGTIISASINYKLK